VEREGLKVEGKPGAGGLRRFTEGVSRVFGRFEEYPCLLLDFDVFAMHALIIDQH
jgi:hypothetical protein